MSKSISRVRSAAERAGLDIEIKRMTGSTRTAEEAAQQCDCAVDQIVKSLIFQGDNTGSLFLFLVRGSKRLDTAMASRAAGEPLSRAEAQTIRDKTGFAIGGVAPIGHIDPISAYADAGLMRFETVWAAAGAHDAVFETKPDDLIRASGAEVLQITADD